MALLNQLNCCRLLEFLRLFIAVMAIAKKILGKAIKKTRQEFGKPKVEKRIKITAKEAKANARGLKAANKPTNKIGFIILLPPPPI